MSARNNNKQSGKNVVKPFCKVCCDAGKSEKEYTSHFVRSDPGPKGVVICPTLLSLECRFCFKNGHTVKFCPVLEERKKAEEKAKKMEEKTLRKEKVEIAEKKAPTGAKKFVNTFAALMSSDSDTEKEVEKPAAKKTAIKSAEKVVVKEEFPALCASSKPVAAVMSGYATMAAKSKQDYDNEKYEQQLIENSIKRQMPPMAKPIAVKKSWADYSSDEEEEYETIVPQQHGKYYNLKASEIDWAIEVDSDEDW